MTRKRRSDAVMDKMIPPIRATEKELEMVQAHATARGMSVSEYIRTRLFSRRASSKQVQQTITIDNTLTSELCRQGAILRKLMDTGAIDAAEAHDVMDKITGTLDVIRRAYESSSVIKTGDA